MRPINLIPDEERRSGVVARTGPVAYLIVGALGVLLIGVVMLVLINNSIQDREGEVTRLETEKTAAVAQASKLSAYTNFKQVSEDRTRTIAELADSRFDWVRVIRQLSLVLPGDVYFEALAASGGGGEGTVAGPSLGIAGCADGQSAVARFVASLKAIDGVTRVGLSNSTVNEEESGGGGKAQTPCSKPGVARFEMVVAFDAAPPSPDSAGSTVGESAESEESESSEGEGSGEEGSEGEGSESESSESEGSSSSEGSESSSSQSASAATAGATG